MLIEKKCNENEVKAAMLPSMICFFLCTEILTKLTQRVLSNDEVTF